MIYNIPLGAQRAVPTERSAELQRERYAKCFLANKGEVRARCLISGGMAGRVV